MDVQELAKIPIVSAARREQKRADSPRSVSAISREEIRRRNYRNIPEAIAGLAGVFLQQTNYAGGSPIIRGMVGNRILLLVNGIRLNNATYRLGPNQYLNFIDINKVERIEVVRGAGSVLYGSDAFGGVINIITQAAPDPRLGSEVSGYARVRLATADQSGEGRVELSGVKGQFGIRAGFTAEGFGDVMGGRGVGRQPYTGYSQTGGDVALQYSIDANKAVSVRMGVLKQFNVQRSDLILSGVNPKYLWTAEGRENISIRYSQTSVSKYIDALQVTLAFQRPFENLSLTTASDRLTERFQQDSEAIYNLAMQLSSTIGEMHTLTYGSETSFDKIHSDRTDVNSLTGLRSVKTGFYPDHAHQGTFAFFVQDELRLSSRLGFVMGARYDQLTLTSKLNDPMIGKLDIDSNTSAIVGSGHILFKATDHLSLTGGISQGFRAPNVNDSSVLGGGGSRFEIPNANLRPERSVNGEYGVRFRGRLGQASVVRFEDHYRDLIDRTPSLLNGQSFVDTNGNGVKDNQEPEVWQRQNINRAVVRGVEFESMIPLAEHWTWTHNMTWTRGTDVSLHTPLTRIPPLYGTSQITWQAHDRLWIEAAVVAATSQHQLAPADKTDTRIGPNGTAGFGAFHLRAGFNHSVLAGLSIAVENVTNKEYKLHGSGIYRSGIDLIVGYSRHF